MQLVMNKPELAIEADSARSPLSAQVERRRTFAIISHPDAGKAPTRPKSS